MALRCLSAFLDMTFNSNELKIERDNCLLNDFDFLGLKQ